MTAPVAIASREISSIRSRDAATQSDEEVRKMERNHSKEQRILVLPNLLASCGVRPGKATKPIGRSSGVDGPLASGGGLDCAVVMRLRYGMDTLGAPRARSSKMDSKMVSILEMTDPARLI